MRVFILQYSKNPYQTTVSAKFLARVSSARKVAAQVAATQLRWPRCCDDGALQEQGAKGSEVIRRDENAIMR